MDKYNVIVPTNNLNDLDKDMEQWAFMPYDLRKRSDEDCIRLYGCTNTDLYKRLKSQILSGEEKKQMDEENKESNLVRESVTAEEILNGINNPEDTLAMSKKLQESPYIVIIDPIVDNMEELNYRFDCFNRLSSKDRRLSNMHSYDLWKYDVYNMYAIVKAAIENKDAAKAEPTSSNLVKEAVEYSTDILVDMYEDNLYRNNFIEACTLKYNLYNQCNSVIFNESYSNYERFYSGRVYNKLDTIFNEFTSFDTYILPKVCPWLTQKELNDNNIKLNVESFSYGNLINASDDELLQYGWSKYYKPTEKNALKEARERQADYIKNHCPIVVNTEGYNITEDTIESNTDLGCIYLMFESSTNLYTNPYVSFDLKDVFLINYDEESEYFCGFLRMNIGSLHNDNLDIYAIPMKKEIIDLIRYNIDNTDDYSDIRFVFDILKNVSNSKSLDAIKVDIMRYLEVLLAIANMNDPNKPYNLYTNNGCDYSKIYKLYSGPVSLIDYNRINTLVYDIINDKFGIKYAKQLLNDTDTNDNLNDSDSNDTTNDTSKDQFIEMIKTRSVIL